MSDLEQANVRVPVGTADAIRNLARLMRKNPQLAHRVRRLILEEEDPATGALLSQRIDRLEAQVRAILAERPLKGLKPADEVGGSGFDIFAGHVDEREWAAGEGRGRRLTPKGEAELQRLIAEGHSDAQIAGRLGIRPFAVKARRRP